MKRIRVANSCLCEVGRMAWDVEQGLGNYFHPSIDCRIDENLHYR